MVRKPRLNLPGGFYPALARGNRRATIFHDDVDPSMISRLTVTYAAQRNSIREAKVHRILDSKIPE